MHALKNCVAFILSVPLNERTLSLCLCLYQISRNVLCTAKILVFISGFIYCKEGEGRSCPSVEYAFL